MPALLKQELTAHAPWRDVTVTLPGDFTLGSGEQLSQPFLRLRLHGAPHLPLAVVMGGISSGRAVCDTEANIGWWGQIAGAGAAIDTGAFQVLGLDFLPNDGETARTISTQDQARALKFALDTLGLDRIDALCGSSFGGMIALAFAALFPAQVERLCVISAAHRAHPATTALRGIQRRIIAFGLEAGRGDAGVALARELAMTTYRSTSEFGARFGKGPAPDAAGGTYDICEYLIARGNAFARDMAPERYITLSDAMDRHKIDPPAITAPTLVVAAENDRLIPYADLASLVQGISGRTTFAQLKSNFGHDAFLVETDGVAIILRKFLEGEAS